MPKFSFPGETLQIGKPLEFRRRQTKPFSKRRGGFDCGDLPCCRRVSRHHPLRPGEPVLHRELGPSPPQTRLGPQEQCHIPLPRPHTTAEQPGIPSRHRTNPAPRPPQHAAQTSNHGIRIRLTGEECSRKRLQKRLAGHHRIKAACSNESLPACAFLRSIFPGAPHTRRNPSSSRSPGVTPGRPKPDPKIRSKPAWNTPPSGS